MKVPLSAVIITFNEEKNIGRCIDSVIPVADEIVVVDSYSKDKTKAICEEKGVRFIEHPFEGHLEQKNWAITQASYPHVLSLDADEALDEKLTAEILNIKEDWKYDGYSMNRLTNYCGKWIYHCGWYPDKKLRLMDSRKGEWKGVNPHDKYELHSRSSEKHIKGNILHYSYYTIDDHINQVNYFTDIAARSHYKKGKRSSMLNILISPCIKFFKDYILKRGFLDGYYGLVICIISSHATFLKYVKMRALTQTNGSE